MRLAFASKCIHIPGLPEILIHSNEKRFRLDGVFQNQKIWIKKDNKGEEQYCFVNKNYEKQSIMVWGAISSKGVFHLERCPKTLDSGNYIKILSEKLKENAEKLFEGNRFILLQDNALCHCSKSTKSFFFKRTNLEVLNLPPCSPDLNGIETI